jgi:tRNA-Thr(GGU) m(6)t(6)A37 methyltransferase TsaA
MPATFQIVPIGTIHQQEAGAPIWIEIAPPYEPGLLGIENFSHIAVLYWFDRNDTPEQRRILQVHPRKNTANPLTGVFATHAPVRPNPIALTVCRLLAVEGRRLRIESIDALDGSPVVDIKGYIPSREEANAVRVPPWVRRGDPA